MQGKSKYGENYVKDKFTSNKEKFAMSTRMCFEK